MFPSLHSDIKQDNNFFCVLVYIIRIIFSLSLSVNEKCSREKENLPQPHAKTGQLFFIISQNTEQFSPFDETVPHGMDIESRSVRRKHNPKPFSPDLHNDF